MTDKQIIINGVDVSKCHNHYNGWSSLHRDNRSMCDCGYDTECKPKYFECSYYVKCLEEQLKRAEQKLEKIKKVYNKYKQTLTEIEEIAEDFYLDGEHVKDKYLAQEILQKISECEVKR